MKRLAFAAALLAAAPLAIAATAHNWLATVTADGTGHRIGNPDAKVRLVEYVSYTCPHCAAFTKEAEGAIQLGYIQPGKVNVEIRNLIRDPIDLTVAMLVDCPPMSRFPQNHSAFLAHQESWIGPMSTATTAQQERWRQPTAAGRRAIASDFKFYDIMERRGYSRAQTDHCLADDALMKRIVASSADDWKKPGIEGTPSFSINGDIMPGTHTWASLKPQLQEFVKKAS
jgi:protein-disulfide isomerase